MLMALPDDLILDAGIVLDEITADDVLAEFLAIMHEWGFRPFRHPADFPSEEQVTLPGPEVLADRAGQAALWAQLILAGRS
jgi:hypothetical protein